MWKLRFLIWLCVGAGLITLTTSCAESVGSGAPVTIPTVVVDCTTAKCRAASSANAFVYITTSSCAWNYLGNATVTSSERITSCNSTTGCRIVMPSTWVSGATNLDTTTIPSGTYTVCAHIDYDFTFPTDTGTNDTTIEIPNVSFVSNMGILQLGGTGSLGSWQDH